MKQNTFYYYNGHIAYIKKIQQTDNQTTTVHYYQGNKPILFKSIIKQSAVVDFITNAVLIETRSGIGPKRFQQFVNNHPEFFI